MRETPVTRTFKITKATALCMDIEMAEPMNKVFNISGEFEDDEKLLKILRKNYDTENEKVVAIVSKEIVEELRSMSQADFLKYSVVIPARNVKED